jgi:hypothetical protein
MDAANLIRDLEPFRQARPVWDRAAEMVNRGGDAKAQRHRGGDPASSRDAPRKFVGVDLVRVAGLLHLWGLLRQSGSHKQVGLALGRSLEAIEDLVVQSGT